MTDSLSQRIDALPVEAVHHQKCAWLASVYKDCDCGVPSLLAEASAALKEKDAELLQLRRVAVMVGVTPVDHSDRGNALYELWAEWKNGPGQALHFRDLVPDEEVAALSAKRAATRARTLASLAAPVPADPVVTGYDGL